MGTGWIREIMCCSPCLTQHLNDISPGRFKCQILSFYCLLSLCTWDIVLEVYFVARSLSAWAFWLLLSSLESGRGDEPPGAYPSLNLLNSLQLIEYIFLSFTSSRAIHALACITASRYLCCSSLSFPSSLFRSSRLHFAPMWSEPEAYCVALSGTQPQLRPASSSSSSVPIPDSHHVSSHVSQRQS